MPEIPSVIVFAGPSWPAGMEVPAGWQLWPPARRGDVLAALATQAGILVLLDGYYFTVPAVTHKEILYALDSGVRVIGAASLGALRAAELEAFGMEGAGTVFDWYRSGRIDGDDEVALLHAPAEHGYKALTLALVEIRHAVEGLTAGERLIAAVKALSFLDRHPARVRELAREILGEPAAEELEARLGGPGLKQRDARAALALADPHRPPDRGPRRRTPTGYLNTYKETSLRCPPGTPESPSLQAAWRMAQLFHPGIPDFVRDIRLRSLLVAAAERGDLQADPDEVLARNKQIRREHLRLLGGLVLPAAEYHEEARCQVLAEQAHAVFFGVEGAARWLAGDLGLPEGNVDDLLRLLASPEALPSWWLARAFCTRPAFREAAAAAEAAEEVHRCFVQWADGARVAMDDLRALAAGFWECAPEAVEAEAARRWLFPSASLSTGLRESLEGIAAAERLPRPINGYPERREALRRSPLF